MGLSPVKWDRPHVVQKSRHSLYDEVFPQVVIEDSLLCSKQELDVDGV